MGFFDGFDPTNIDSPIRDYICPGCGSQLRLDGSMSFTAARLQRRICPVCGTPSDLEASAEFLGIGRVPLEYPITPTVIKREEPKLTWNQMAKGSTAGAVVAAEVAKGIQTEQNKPLYNALYIPNPLAGIFKNLTVGAVAVGVGALVLILVLQNRKA